MLPDDLALVVEVGDHHLVVEDLHRHLPRRARPRATRRGHPTRQPRRQGQELSRGLGGGHRGGRPRAGAGGRRVAEALGQGSARAVHARGELQGEGARVVVQLAHGRAASVEKGDSRAEGWRGSNWAREQGGAMHGACARQRMAAPPCHFRTPRPLLTSATASSHRPSPPHPTDAAAPPSRPRSMDLPKESASHASAVPVYCAQTV